ncbi:hypothetical protein D7V91_11810 [bacterium 1xD42-67]|nr:hypothetical protein D7V91_11810 [bacterium 1xD42-67]
MSETIVNASAVSLKDYIIDLSGAQQKPSVTYEVVLENNTDFILRRQTQKVCRELVILVSQGLYYIRDCKSGVIDPVTTGNLRSFLRDLKDNYIDLKQVNWIGALFKESVDFIATVTGDAVLSDMCRHNVPISVEEPQKYVQYWEQNKRLFTRIAQLFPAQTTVNGKYQNCIPAIFWIEKQYGANEAMYFAEQLVRSGVRDIRFDPAYCYPPTQSPHFLTKIMESEYNINLRRFIDYICFDLYRQGYGDVTDTFFQEYLDYLSMQKKFYGKVKEKYPEHFKTAHDVMALKTNLAKIAEQCQNFAEQAEMVKDLEFSAQGYSIVVPTEPRELADEGINLSHCVGDYIDRVASGECHILFLRRRNAPEQSLVTLQLSGRSICQAQGANRRAITQSERKFLTYWAREKQIEIAV